MKYKIPESYEFSTTDYIKTNYSRFKGWGNYHYMKATIELRRKGYTEIRKNKGTYWRRNCM